MRKGRYPMLERVVGGAFKENLTVPYTLTYLHPKLGGSTEIELSYYADWANRMSLRRDKETASAIKKGLGAIVSKKIEHSLVGLEVDSIFQGLNWRITPVEG